ncbi:hypothetical protein [Streptomyces sp. NPDC001816]|uniref:hypothetical protein n=1 Tax=Streptomyces sp. NPDC001816 TaxID=3364612 RepID=UPI0036B1284E
MSDMELAAVHLGEDFQGKAILVVAGAILAFIGNFLLDQYKRRREPRKRLTWTAHTQVGIVSVDPKFQQLVKLAYNEEPIENICALDFKVKNTGTEVVKNHQVRLAFPEESKVLEARLSPEPDRELGVIRNAAKEEANSEVVYEIGHLEVGEEVNIQVVATGRTAKDWRVRSHNDEGNVRFEEREVQRITDDTEHIVPFVVLMITLWFLPGVFSYAGSLGGLAAGVVQLALFVALISQLVPVARILRDLVLRMQSDRPAVPTSAGRDEFVVRYDRETFVTDVPSKFEESKGSDGS